MLVNKNYYSILDTYYRTKGSKNQFLLLESSIKRIETGVIYYLAERLGKKYWIKETRFPPEHYNNQSTCIKETKKEYRRGVKNDFSFTYGERGEHRVRTVKYIEYQDNIVVQEYCEGYHPFRYNYNVPKDVLIRLLYGWLDCLTTNNYDMSVNNIMVKFNGTGWRIIMVDMAESDKTIEICKDIVDGLST